jgi:hypothetical protein
MLGIRSDCEQVPTLSKQFVRFTLYLDALYLSNLLLWSSHVPMMRLDTRGSQSSFRSPVLSGRAGGAHGGN